MLLNNKPVTIFLCSTFGHVWLQCHPPWSTIYKDPCSFKAQRKRNLCISRYRRLVHRCCYRVLLMLQGVGTRNGDIRHSDAVKFSPQQIPFSNISTADYLRQAITSTITILQKKSSNLYSLMYEQQLTMHTLKFLSYYNVLLSLLQNYNPSSLHLPCLWGWTHPLFYLPYVLHLWEWCQKK